MYFQEEGGKSNIYGRAMRSRILRRMGRILEAEQDEQWLSYGTNPYTWSPSEIITLLTDPSEPHNHILSHPTMYSFGKGVYEFPSAGNGVFGRAIIAFDAQPGLLPDSVLKNLVVQHIERLTKAPAANGLQPSGYNPVEVQE